MTVLTVFQMRIPDRVFFVYGTSVCLSSDEDKAAEESEHIDYENGLSESNADISDVSHDQDDASDDDDQDINMLWYKSTSKNLPL